MSLIEISPSISKSKKKSAGKPQEASATEIVDESSRAPILDALEDPYDLSSLKIVSETEYSRCHGIRDALVFNRNKRASKRECK